MFESKKKVWMENTVNLVLNNCTVFVLYKKITNISDKVFENTFKY